MNKILKLISLGFLLVLGLVGFSGCSEDTSAQKEKSENIELPSFPEDKK